MLRLLEHYTSIQGECDRTGTPTQFIQFVQSSQQTGPDDALRRIYRIDGLNQLHERWLAYARSNTGTATASAAPDESSSSRAR